MILFHHAPGARLQLLEEGYLLNGLLPLLRIGRQQPLQRHRATVVALLDGVDEREAALSDSPPDSDL